MKSTKSSSNTRVAMEFRFTPCAPGARRRGASCRFTCSCRTNGACCGHTGYRRRSRNASASSSMERPSTRTSSLFQTRRPTTTRSSIAELHEAARLLEAEPRVARHDALPRAIAYVDEEVGFEAAVGEEGGIRLGEVEPRHGAAIQADGAQRKQVVTALQRPVAECGDLGVRALVLEPVDGIGVVKHAWQVFPEARVVGNQRHQRRPHGFVEVGRAQARAQLLARFL